MWKKMTGRQCLKLNMTKNFLCVLQLYEMRNEIPSLWVI